MAVAWRVGDDVREERPDEAPRLFTVVKRQKGGFVLRPKGGGEDVERTDDEIRWGRCFGELEHHPAAPAGLTAARRAVLERDSGTEDPEHRQVARVKVEYCFRVESLLDAGVPFDEAYARAAEEVYASEVGRWTKAFEDIRAVREADRLRKRRLPPELLKKKPARLGLGMLERPRPSTVETWFREWSSNGRDERMLLPLFNSRGDHGKKLEHRTYERMRWWIEDVYLKLEQAPLAWVHREMVKEIGNVVSYTTFRAFLKKEYAAYFVEKNRLGGRQAFLRNTVFKRLRHDQVAGKDIEIDHCLLDVLVRDPSRRVVGRPWLTVAMCRSTRMIVGCHLSFEQPSYASLQRCLIHAIWPKDLSGLKLENDWPCEGTPDRATVDQGKEFYSASLKATETALKFQIVPLPGRMPWLKGTVERLFGTIGVQVIAWMPGKTFSNVVKRGDYPSTKKARFTITQIRDFLLKWIVDDYHVSWHEGLGGVPLQEWYRRRPAEVESLSVNKITELTGVFAMKKIGEKGVRANSQYYLHPVLNELKRQYGRDREYEFRHDPFDIGHGLLKHPQGRWIRLESDRPERSVGKSLFQFKVDARLAKALTLKGEHVTQERLTKAAEQAAEEAMDAVNNGSAKTTAASAARYHYDNGQFFTPIGRPRPNPALEGLPAVDDAFPERAAGPVNETADTLGSSDSDTDQVSMAPEPSGPRAARSRSEDAPASPRTSVSKAEKAARSKPKPSREFTAPDADVVRVSFDRVQAEIEERRALMVSRRTAPRRREVDPPVDRPEPEAMRPILPLPPENQARASDQHRSPAKSSNTKRNQP
ncbi:DDE-type integrase/transposase/recombinase [Aureimonas sp. AU22]|uniref:DDE-type integrase/transposase/recombinase n=1 Tax=Aureimonas sp. AU22 TaxID=1638162 RepID=UPI0012E33461|nr:DDE-type integrase/transposase/recombinase [Aureimonas sp. AU22]